MISNEDKVVLDLGCGERKLENAIGIDIIKTDAVDIVHDLNTFPYPLKDNFFDEIHMFDVIEHLDNVIKVMSECHRILKPAGKLIITVVYWNSMNTWSDPTHIRGFSEKSFSFFMGNRKYYGSPQFSNMDIEYGYNKSGIFKYIPNKIKKRLGRYLCNIIMNMRITLTK